MAIATSSVPCIFLVVVTTTDWFVDCARSHGLPNPGYDWCISNAHHWYSFPKIVQRVETQLEPLATSLSATRPKLLAIPRVRNLRDMNPLNPLESPHGTTPLKLSMRDWVLTSYYFGHIFLQMRSNVSINDILGKNGDIMVQNGIFWTIGEHLFYGLFYPIISCKE